MITEAISIGFDLRVDTKSDAAISTINNIKNDQLIRPDVRSVLSADPLVWPRDALIEEIYNRDNSTNPFGFFNSPLPSNIPRIQHVKLVQICMTIMYLDFVILEEFYGPKMFGTQFTEADLTRTGWRRRGYDVIDIRRMISGLSGCGYNLSTKDLLRENFTRCINRFGLLRTVNAARAFSEVRGLQIRSHAPFVVVGVLTKEFASKSSLPIRNG